MREAGAIRLGRDGLQLYEQSGYGRPVGDGLSLVPVEALYLVHRGRLELPGESFESLLAEFTVDPHFLRTYLVYRDLRERGYVVQTGPHDFRVFRRGQRPGSGQSQYMVRVLSERDPIAFDQVIAEATSTAQMRKSHLLAAVDDEDELTYYEVKLPALPQRDAAVPGRSVAARPFGWAVIAYGEEGAVLEASGYGTRIDDRRLKLAPVEAVYLIENGWLVLEGGALETGDYGPVVEGVDGEASEKSAVYAHLRDRGYTPRTGYKFGHHYRVYGAAKTHSEMLVHALPGGMTMPMSVISRSVRLAHSVKKKMLFGCVHTEGIFFVEFARIKL
jgi:tRNA-intron endonuclease, archaea type